MLKIAIACLCLLSLPCQGQASRSDETLSDWTLVRVPACLSRELAAHVYWSAVRYGNLMAEVIYLAPLQNKGVCGWYDLFVPEGYLFPCSLGWSFDCDAVEWQARGGKVYLVVWPK